MAALRKLAEKCDFRDFLNQALHDKLVCGLCNENIQRKLLAEADLTLQRAFEVAQGIEATQHQASELQASNVSHEVHAVTATKRACFHSGKANQSPEECYFRAQTCRKCGKVGHVAKVCRDKKLQARRIKRQTMCKKNHMIRI